MPVISMFTFEDTTEPGVSPEKLVSYTKVEYCLLLLGQLL